MPNEIQTGRAVLYGIQSSNGLGISGTTEATGYASFIWDSAKAQHKFKIHDVQDENEFDAAAIAVNAHKELDIKFTPAGATRAELQGKVVFLEPLSKVTLSGFKIDAFNGDYQYRGDQSIDLSKAVGSMMLKIRKYDDDDQNASLTTTVEG